MIVDGAQTITELIASWLRRVSSIASVDLVTFEHVRTQIDLGYEDPPDTSAINSTEAGRLAKLPGWDRLLLDLLSDDEDIEYHAADFSHTIPHCYSQR